MMTDKIRKRQFFSYKIIQKNEQNFIKLPLLFSNRLEFLYSL